MSVVPNLRFSEFEEQWKYSSIGQMGAEISDGNYGEMYPKADQFVESGVPFIRANNLSSGRVVWSSMRFIPADLHSVLKSGHLQVNDILVTTRGEIGTVALVPKDFAGANINAQICLVRDMEECDQSYLFYCLQRNDAKRQFVELTTGSALKQLPRKNLKKVSIWRPSPPEQKKIADFLGAVDDKIAGLREREHLLTQYKKGVMQKIFSQTLCFKADDGSDFPDWGTKRADEVFRNHSNKNHDGTLPILAITQEHGAVLRADIGIDIKSTQASVDSYKVVEVGDFIISLRSFQGGIEYSDVMGICSPAYTILKPNIEISNGFFKQYMKMGDFIQRLSMTVVGIRDGKQISYGAFSTLMLQYPHPDEQQKISDFLSAIDEKITTVSAQITQMQDFKKGLLQQMFV